MNDANAVLDASGITKSYRIGIWPFRRPHNVLNGVTLAIEPGQVTGLVGENGSGKSTLLRILAGIMPADQGTVSIRGRLGYCPQEPVLFDKLTVSETFRLFGRAYGLTQGELHRRTADLLGALRFEPYRDTRVEHLSGGTRQKLNLAVALLHEPSLLLLDEPYAGFDYETYLRFWDLASGLVRRGASILVVSHFISDLERFDRIFTLKEGACVTL